MRITAKTFSHLDLNSYDKIAYKNFIANIVPREITKSDLNAEWLLKRLHQFDHRNLMDNYETLRRHTDLNLDALLFTTNIPSRVDYSRNTALNIIEELFNAVKRPVYVEFSRGDLVLHYGDAITEFDTSRIFNALKQDADYVRQFDYFIDCAENYYNKPLKQINMIHLDWALCRNVANGSFKCHDNLPKDDVCEKYIALFDKLFPDLNLTPKHEQPILQRPF